MEHANLCRRSCKPCKGGIPSLTPAEITPLLAQVPGWQLSSDGKSISREWKFRNYASPLAFVVKASEIFEMEGHHPDVAFGWGYARITLTTHAINGLSENDFILAAKVDQLHLP